MKKKFGDRRDGVRLRLGGFEKIWNCLKSKRSENEVHILREIDVTELKKYYDDDILGNKIVDCIIRYDGICKDCIKKEKEN